MPTLSFSSLALNPAQLSNLEQLGYQQMTPIQAQSLPVILNGQDVLAQAKTGSGKTAAFGIGLLERLGDANQQVQALVLCPTRELGTQVAEELRRLARYRPNTKILLLCGGVSIGPQIGSLAHGADIIVGTPGRVMDHLRKGTLSLRHCHTLVLDEADRMLDMGFIDAMRSIVKTLPSKRQTLLFSATYPDTIAEISAEFQHKPQAVSVEAVHSHSQIRQYFYQVDKAQRADALCQLLCHYTPEATMVFCNTKVQCNELNDYLNQAGHASVTLHGDLEQRERDLVLLKFANGSASVLVATDVAARGLDIPDLPAVVNFELSRQPEVYVHRIGRTGRAGKEGLAMSFYSESEKYKLEAISTALGQELKNGRVPNKSLNAKPPLPKMATLCIAGGKKDKVRAGDILGALTGDAGISGKQVGKIHIFDFVSYVAVERQVAKQALNRLQEKGLKGRKFKLKRI
ncbi:ATP-dependent RNA helicase DbpA [Balneatrix alpica]|uniref:ATP-dependent RNA helicase DbpA n=1 Tax=Balneatrix alpica TaxID=75684 RepID=A0ABV5ZE25_9GAMM|nr:ATP-dependent RNA helicase DbpA [Balneatrix alpica]